ncbi:hypothetical protein GCM10020221_30080 [Streptomyces thioluteus]|uniref:Uncharacterized protein n=1 Tax=Streptomyces thioluteus TaxID=66431 RepID=A0ABN3X0E4_STRTU
MRGGARRTRNGLIAALVVAALVVGGLVWAWWAGTRAAGAPEGTAATAVTAVPDGPGRAGPVVVRRALPVRSPSSSSSPPSASPSSPSSSSSSPSPDAPGSAVGVTVTADRDRYSGPCPAPEQRAPAFHALLTVDRVPARVWSTGGSPAAGG